MYIRSKNVILEKYITYRAGLENWNSNTWLIETIGKNSGRLNYNSITTIGNISEHELLWCNYKDHKLLVYPFSSNANNGGDHYLVEPWQL